MNFELQLETGASLLKQAPQDVLQMSMIIARKEVTYQQAGTTSSKASPPDISKE